MKKFFLAFLLLAICFSAATQELYIPRNIKTAYDNEVCSLTAAPGPKYWQNHRTYDIKIMDAIPLNNILKF